MDSVQPAAARLGDGRTCGTQTAQLRGRDICLLGGGDVSQKAQIEARSFRVFTATNRIITGIGSIERLGEEAKALGTKALLVTGTTALKHHGLLDRIVGSLQSAGVNVVLYNKVEPEPTLRMVEKGIFEVLQHKCDLVIGIGGGSAIDVGKAIAALSKADGAVKEYFNGRRLTRKGLPYIAVPTTSGTGSEATAISVLTDEETGSKVGMKDPLMQPDAAIVDPELAVTAPPHVTAHSGMDALTQAVESYTSRYSTPITAPLALQAVRLISGSLVAAYLDGHDIGARADVAYGSLLAGIAFNVSRLGLVHGIANPMGGATGKPHGLICGVLLPHVMKFNLPVAAERYAEIAAAMGIPVAGLSTREAAGKAIARVEDMRRQLEVPKGLRDIGVGEADIPRIAEETFRSGSTTANPRSVTYEDVVEFLRQIL